ncbi:hypothetical protein C2845_PM17G06450 [Panicum miliaceum]|uniref:Uncharacterized protein n=1 Tax=Panicum miliaceum TaxID=4540 RepID=A0A3L6Q0I1_PANMI|nr:hypothetical protein C2845_PM17G06450 [Panicum miliaceum]
MWAALQACFRFPKGKLKEDAKKFAMITLGTAFRNFRHTLHKDYVKKGLSPKSKFGKIPDTMWEEFKLMKNKSEAQALSQQMTEKAQKAAENPHHLGAGGYDGMIPHWRREEEERRKASLPDLFEGIDDRAKYWCLARRPRNRGGKIVYENPTTAKIYERLAQIVEAQKQGLPSQELQPRPEANIEHAAPSTVPEGNNHVGDQTTPAGNDGVDEFPAHDPTPPEPLVLEANIEAERPVLPSPQSPPKITKKPSPQAPQKMPEIPRMISTYEKAPSADVDKFLGALNKMPSSSKTRKRSLYEGK